MKILLKKMYHCCAYDRIVNPVCIRKIDFLLFLMSLYKCNFPVEATKTNCLTSQQAILTVCHPPIYPVQNPNHCSLIFFI